MKGPATLAHKQRNRGRTVVGEFCRIAAVSHDRLLGSQWPSPKYRDNPVGFVREVLHGDPMAHQAEILNSIRDNPLTAVSSGQKIGKTLTIAWAMLWYWASFPGAKVTITATTETQVDNVNWDEVRNVIRTAKEFGHDLLAGGATLAQNPRTGLEAPDGRVIR